MTKKDYKTALRMITYERIHHLRDVEHRSIQRIADDLGLNFRTVKKVSGDEPRRVRGVHELNHSETICT